MSRLRITPELLKKLCADTRSASYRAFCKRWPDGATMTIANVKEALKLDLDVEFLAENLLPRPKKNALRKESYRIRSAYRVQTSDIWLKLGLKQGRLAMYEKLRAKPRRDRDEALARAFVKAFKSAKILNTIRAERSDT